MTIGRFQGWGIAGVLTLCVSLAEAATLTEIQDLLDSGKFAQAYTAAVELEPAQAGDPEFDFLLGQAAAESGHLSHAVFAFERVLMVSPQQHRARIELARVYFLQEDYRAAKAEFETVLAQNPPPNVKARIGVFLQVIDERLTALTRRRTVYASVATGYDSNVNGATSQDSVNVPALGTVALTSTSQETEDGFAEIVVGGDAAYKLSRQSDVALAADLRRRNAFSYSEFDTDTGTLRLAYDLNKPSYQLSVPVQFQQLNVDGNPYRRMTTLSAELAVPRGESSQIAYFAMLGALRFPDFSDKETDLLSAGASWQGRLSGGSLLAIAGIYYGHEEAREDAGEYNGRRYVGIRGQIQKQVAQRQSLSAAFVYQQVSHLAEDIVFTERREEDFYQLTASSLWQLSKRWSAALGIEYYVNDANLPIYEYDRVVAKAGVNYVY